MRRTLALLFGLTALLSLLLGIRLHLHADAFSARAQPSRVEALLARTARQLATPSATRERRNPVAYTPAALQEGMDHFADHCALCHGNDGAGQTMLGMGMYPKPPDMRLATTQNRTDGELFSLIENGIRLSGMPAFGGSGGTEEESWKLVVFLRHLPSLTPAEQAGMQRANPRSPMEMEEEKQEEEFLNGDAPGKAGRHQERPDGVKHGA